MRSDDYDSTCQSQLSTDFELDTWVAKGLETPTWEAKKEMVADN